MINQTAIEVDTDKIKEISEAPTLSNMTELSSFLGLVGYYQSITRNFEISVRKASEWTPGTQEAFVLDGGSDDASSTRISVFRLPYPH